MQIALYRGQKAVASRQHEILNKENLDMIQHPIWQEIDSLRREMETIFNTLTSRTPGWSPRFRLMDSTGGREPSVQMCSDDEALYIQAVIPGVDPASLDLAVESNVLTLSGEKPRLYGANDATRVHRQERAAGKFTRRMSLPVEVDTNQVSADYTHGVLRVKLPKAEKAKARQISIQAV
jgi:HSP20 family protein